MKKDYRTFSLPFFLKRESTDGGDAEGAREGFTF
jgi:hypothetical protein